MCNFSHKLKVISVLSWKSLMNTDNPASTFLVKWVIEILHWQKFSREFRDTSLTEIFKGIYLNAWHKRVNFLAHHFPVYGKLKCSIFMQKVALQRKRNLPHKNRTLGFAINWKMMSQEIYPFVSKVKINSLENFPSVNYFYNWFYRKCSIYIPPKNVGKSCFPTFSGGIDRNGTLGKNGLRS